MVQRVPMARLSPAALDVMEHIAEAMDVLDVLLASIDRLEGGDIAREVVHAREELMLAKRDGAELLLEMLNLSEQQALMQDEIKQIRGAH
jgi:hypothetical protein